jgi:two-component sensor histidine kinase/ligand-binding sensor protein
MTDDRTAIELGDLVDLERLQKMADHLYAAGGIPVGILDVSGRILVGAGWQRICTEFHRVNPETARRCTESDSYIDSHLDEKGVLAYKCRNMLWDLALPITIGGMHLGTLFVGQFFYDDEDVDHEAFRKQAEEFGFDWKEYREALDEVPRFTRERVASMMEYYRRLVEELANSGHTILRLREAERRIAESLREKEILLKEVHHRVKNNLNVIVSLLGLELDGLVDEAERAILEDSQARIYAIALVYDSLYQQEDLSSLDLGDYLAGLTDRLGAIYDPEGRVTVELRADPVSLGVDAIIACGMSTCEIITNSYKYAFAGGRKGRVRIEVGERGGAARILVADDGPGAPEAVVEGRESGLGLRIARELVKGRLKGSLSLANSGGLTASISFRMDGGEEP